MKTEVLIETQFTHLPRSLTDSNRAQVAFNPLGKGRVQGTPVPLPMPWALRAPEPPSGRMAAGTPSVLTAREINRGINFRETSLALRPSLQNTMSSRCLAIRVKSDSFTTDVAWPAASKLPGGGGRAHKLVRHPHNRLQGLRTTQAGRRDSLWSSNGKGQAWSEGQIQVPRPYSRPHTDLSHPH